MSRLLLVLFILLSTGCATGLTPEGRRIKVIHDDSHGAVAECERLGLVRGEAASFLSGGDYGEFYATNDARNKAARVAGADTLVIVGNQSRGFGGEVVGTAYNCHPQRHGEAQAAPATAIRKAPATDTSRADIFEKARKCQGKGGVWVNNQCVIPIE